MTIGQLSQRTSVPIKVLRHYEDLGFLYTLGRSESNYRLFGEEAIWCVPRIAQRGCGRANPDVMSESHAEPDVELVRENRNRGMESKKGRGWEELRNSQT